ncbi:MAG: ATP-binding cassette domain-containing protein [Desulfuromonadales bacterium]
MIRQATKHILELKETSFRYPDGSVGLDRCSLTILRGSRTVVLGANGSGKTTLFVHLNGILRPQTGTVLYSGAPLEYSRKGLHSLRSHVGLVFQNPDSQLFSASVREDVSFGPLNLGLDVRTVRKRVEDALQAVGMVECADKPVHNLSYGQKKRVCVAGVLAMQPEVIVLDEPMAGLDVAMQKELTAILDRLHTAGLTVLIATHDIDFAYGWSDEAIVLQKGRPLSQGNAKEVLQLSEVQTELGASPIVAEIVRSLALTGIDVCANGNPPRNRAELVKAIAAQTKQESNR